MGMTWTEEQKKVISLRDRNILVSAAAGSGKTAVLVQRILSKVTDKERPVDIDRLLIMTFTRAAAGEMKERISRALEEALYQDPENDHLQRQMTLIHTAQITTIDGFCSYIIRNYFHLIGLDPGYRTADEGELKLLKEEVLKELMEDYSAKDEERYRYFVDCYSPGKSDEEIKGFILQLYDAAMSNPYPEEWMRECLNTYEVMGTEELEASRWMELMWESVREEAEEIKTLAEEAKRICLEPGGPYLYEEALDGDLLFLDRLTEKIKERDYDGVSALFGGLSFARLSTKKPKEAVDGQKKERVKNLREEEKSALKDLGTRYFQSTLEQLLEAVQCCREPMEMLVELTKAFIDRFQAAKQEKNILDFTDMEHFALKILMEKEGDTIHMSQAARELSQKYDEVLVDEYQDSNLVQELLTNCVSGWVNQRRNIFMVGDVKQSIYRFRLARPELFMEKYKAYTLEDSQEQRIDLHKNFRSRPQVLESVNYIFRQVMGEDLGGITYDDSAALYPGASFPEGQDEEFVKTEVLLVEKDGQELEEEQGNQNARELEALAIAHWIQSMIGKEKVLDKETGEYRPVEYGDMVILLRTSAGWSETFSEVLSAQGIPSYTASKTGYFSALEVVTILNYLRICDNPLQDVPMAGVLRSPIAGFTSQELAVLRSLYPEGKLYEIICSFLEEEENRKDGVSLSDIREEDCDLPALRERLTGFCRLLEEVRDRAAYTPVHELILYILDRTGYGRYAQALPDGAQRSANLSMLAEKAMDYEKTSYRGLFNFVRYIEHLQKYEVDYGEVNLSGAGEGSVQIMTIHKSKGLEFPVVFAAGMGKQFNFQDMNARLLVHPELGLGADAILPEKRMIVPTLHKQVIRKEILKESLGEELRVLYVALTRAKEKLILTGTIGKTEEQLLSLTRFTDKKVELLPTGTRQKAKTYWSYILPALARHRCMDELYREYGIPYHPGNPLHNVPADFIVTKVTAKEMIEEEILRQTGTELEEAALKNWDANRIYNEEIRQELEKRFHYIYPNSYLKEIPVKVSVSELKKRSYVDEQEKEEAIFYEEKEEAPMIPRFMMEKEEEYTGAARGSAYHRVMECLDYTKTSSYEEIKKQIESLAEQQKLTPEEAGCVKIHDIRQFLSSPLGQRMKKAGICGNLIREQPFMVSMPSTVLNENWPQEEQILVQGIIDAYFFEEKDIILTDYKTDRIEKGQEQKLIDRYHTQLEDYAIALERMTGKRVKEKYIYSFTLGKEIRL